MNENIVEATKVINEYLNILSTDKLVNIKNFREIVNDLISSTPTGEVRNKITDLNIIFEGIIMQLEFEEAISRAINTTQR